MMMQFINATLCGVHNVIKWTKHSTNFASYHSHSFGSSQNKPNQNRTEQQQQQRKKSNNQQIVQNVSVYRACSQTANTELDKMNGIGKFISNLQVPQKCIYTHTPYGEALTY